MTQLLGVRDSRELLKKYSALIMFIALLVINSIVTPNFLAVNTFSLMLTQICPTILTAMGMTMVISTGGIDISVGAVMALSASIATAFIDFSAPGSAFMLTLILLAAVVLASSSGFLAGFMVGKLKVQPMVVTLGLLIGLRGLAIVISQSKPVYLTGSYGELFKTLGSYKIGGVVPIQIVPILLSIALTYFIMNKTVLGRRIQAVGNNPRSAKLAGINTTTTLLIVYVFSALLAGVAGIFATAKIGNFNSNDLGLLTELDAIAAVVIGGTKMTGGRARVMGTVIGAFIMISLSMTIHMNNIPYEFAQIIKALIIVFAVYIQQDK